MLSERCFFICVVVMHLLAPAGTECQDRVNAASTDSFTPPAVIPIYIPADKPAHRHMAGCELLGVVYTYDVAQSNAEYLKVFETIQEIQNADNRRVMSIWTLQMGVIRDGYTYPIAGGLYRWQATQSQFARVDSGAIELNQIRRRVAVINRLHLGRMRGDEEAFQMQIQQFSDGAKTDANEPTVQTKFFGDEGGLELMDQKTESRSPTLWLKQGDRVKSKYWEVKLHRIVLPNAEQKVSGWAEFEVTPRF